MSRRFAAEILEGSTSALAGFAASRLLERNPEAEARFAPSAFAGWRTYLEQRIRELAAALAADEPELFLGSVDWNRQAFVAREVPEQDLRASLECLAQVLEEELPENARQPVGEVLAAALARFDEPPGSGEQGPDPASPTGKLALRYLLAVLEGDRQQATDLVLDAVDGDELTVEQAYLEVLLPAQREVGRLWHTHEMSVAEEHFVTATTKRLMSLLSQRSERAAPNGKTVVAAGVAGDVHDIGVRVVADFFEMAGWRVIYLGSDLPVLEVVDAAQRFDADLFVLSATLSTQLRPMQLAIEALRQDGGPKVLVGGLAFAGAAELWKRLGADGYAASPEEAVGTGARLVGL